MSGKSGGGKGRIIVLDNVAHLPEQNQTLGLCKGLGDEGRLWDSVAIRGIGFAFAKHVPDSGQEHAANGDDGFLVTAVSLDAAVANAEFRVILGFNDSVGDLDKSRLQARARSRDSGGLDGFIALVISGAATRPRDEILGRGKHGHINADFGDDGDSGQGILIEARDSVNQVEGGCERGDETTDFPFDLGAVLFEFVDVVETLAEFDSLLMGDSAVHSGLNLGDWGFTAPVNERRDVERLPGVRQDVLGDGTRGLAEHVREHIVEFEIGHGETVLGAITAKIKNGKTLKCIVNVMDPLTLSVDKITDTSVYNEAYIRFSNNSKRKIVYVKFDIAQYNNRGDKLKSPYNSFYLNDDVEARSNKTFEFWVHDDTKSVSLSISEVTFADGTIWKP